MGKYCNEMGYSLFENVPFYPHLLISRNAS